MTDFCAIAEAYAREVMVDDGSRFCKWTKLVAARHLADLARAETDPDWPYWFSEWDGNDICEFAELLPHVEGTWRSASITLEPAQVFWLVSLFGWRRWGVDARRFSSVYIEMARKNAKSTLAAIIALYCLTSERENGPQVLIAATTGEQAGKVFTPAKRMVERTTALREAYFVQAFARSISCGSSQGFIQPINAKASTQDGWNPHCAILDELHAHKDRGLYDVVRSAFGARRNPLMLAITTAGHNHEGVCYEQRTLLTNMLEGILQADHMWGIIYTLDEGDDPFDPRNWIKANPLLGVSIQLTELQGYAIEAQNSNEAAYEFKTKRCCLWLTARGGHVRIEQWRKCDGPVELEALETVPAYGGLDLAATTDMCAFRLVWRTGGRTKTWGRFYLPEGAIAPRSEKASVPYATWRDRGLVRVTEGNVVDYAVIQADIEAALDRFNVRGIAFDPWNASDLVNRLTEKGAPMVEFRQGVRSFNAPMKELDRLYIAGELDHGGDVVLAWNASNVVARADDNGNIKPDRRNSQEKIDGYVALLMALGLAIGSEDGESVYESRGLLTLG